LPQGVRAITVGKHLHVTTLSINGKVVGADVKDGRITLPAHAKETHVRLEYYGVFAETDDTRQIPLISKRGVFLLRDWYPAAEADLARFFLKAKVPEGFYPVSEADAVLVAETGGEKVVSFDFPHPVPEIHFVMARYVLTTDRYQDVELETYLLPEDQGLAPRYLAHIKKYLRMYEHMLGPYPFRRFAVVENILPTGYGMPTFTLLGRQVLKLPFIPETSLGHEILHSWFGNAVYVDYAAGNWCEGLTSYLADHHYKELEGEGWRCRKKILEDYESYVHEGNEIPTASFIGGKNRPSRAVGYGKTAMFFHMLKNRIGEKAFAKALKVLVREQLFQITSWQDLERIFAEEAEEDLGGFFQFWLEQKGAMELDVERIQLRDSGTGYELRLRVRLANSPLPVSVPVAALTGNETERRLLSVSGREYTYSLSLNARPQQIVLDPDYELFRTLKPAERRPVLSRLLGDPGRTIVIPEANRDVYQGLIEALRSRGFHSVPGKDLESSALGKGAFLFLGPLSRHEFLFPGAKETAQGFSLRIRENPFNPKRVVGLALAESAEEIKPVIPKLFRYGKYSRVTFSQGKNVEKKIQESDRGIRLHVPAPVSGISLQAVRPLSEIISRIAEKSIVYIGEKHNRYGDHLMQLEVIRGLHKHYPELAIGMEMFQRRYQEALDDYISGAIDEQTFLKESHYFSTWKFNYHLYRDILHYARDHKIPVIALNQANELVSKVAREGIASLEEEEKGRLPEEMFFDDEAYKSRLRRVFDLHQTELDAGAPRVFEYFHQAQILWDETMAESIAAFLADHPHHHLVVLAGNGHLAYGSGIPKRALRRIPKDYAIILPEPGEPLEEGLADFIVFPGDHKAPQSPKLGVMLDTGEDRLVVTGFSHGSGAREAGIQEGDVILEVSGKSVETVDDLHSFLAVSKAGERMPVTVQRGKEEIQLEVELRTFHERAWKHPTP
ncbi:MAG: ChaN family lipoprotein, partial [Syntrophobacteria bacterium]